MPILHIKQARELGYAIDESAAGRPYAYKGPRFQPTAFASCYTENETLLIEAMREILAKTEGTMASPQQIADIASRALAGVGQ